MKTTNERSDKFASLELLVFASDVIAIGRFEGIRRPVDAPTPSNVFAFRIEHYLKGKGDGMVKILCPGGAMSTGARYIVFLERPDTRVPAHLERGYVSKLMPDGRREITQYLDEYNFTSTLQGKVLLQEGRALSCDLASSSQYLHWRFPFGKEQIIDLSEAEAVHTIQSMVRYDYSLHRGTTRYRSMPPPP